MLVVRHRGAADPLSPRRQVSSVGQPGEGDVEADKENVRAEWVEVRRMFDDVRATPAALTFLRGTRVGMMVTLALPLEEEEGEGGR